MRYNNLKQNRNKKVIKWKTIIFYTIVKKLDMINSSLYLNKIKKIYFNLFKINIFFILINISINFFKKNT